MGLFGKKSEGGLMDVIRCDEQEYLVWKWRPSGDANSTNKENAIRYGSSLRVKDGEVAVFVYKQKDGAMQDFIVGQVYICFFLICQLRGPKKSECLVLSKYVQ